MVRRVPSPKITSVERFIAGWSLLSLFLAAATPSIAVEPTISVTADRERIYLGESFLLTVRVAGPTEQPEPDLSALRNCTLRLLDSQAQNFQQIVIVNGRMQKTGFVGRIFTFEVTPSVAGPFQAGPITTTVAGHRLFAEGPLIQVDEVERQREVLVSLTPSRESILVTEPFEITLTVAIRALSAPHDDLQPLDPRNPPHLRASYLDGEAIKGLEMPDVRGTLEKMLTRTGRKVGFHVNEYTVWTDPFDMRNIFDFDSAFRNERAVFQFPYRFVEKNGERYVEYYLVLRYTPKQEGTYTFGPAVFKGQVIAGILGREPHLSRPIFAVGPACHVRVVPPPEEGRPAYYVGAIGRSMQIEAALDTQSCNVGDPLSLTLAITGEISLDNLRIPSLASQAELLKDFRVREDPVQIATKDGRREYTFQIRPVRAGTYELPPIAVAYFDLNDRCYKTVHSRPIPLSVRATVQVDSQSVISTASEGSSGEEQLASGNSVKVVAPILVAPFGAEPMTLLGGKGTLLILAVGPVAYASTMGARVLRNHIARLRKSSRKRLAAARAANLLRQAEQLAQSDAGKACSLVCHALRTYVGDCFERSAVSLAPADAAQILAEQGIAEPLVSLFHRLMEGCFNAIYSRHSDQSHSPESLAREARDLIARIEQELRAKKKEANRQHEEVD
ncbi:MAG: BatD family protein [Kiritimatiellia bacterium]